VSAIRFYQASGVAWTLVGDEIQFTYTPIPLYRAFLHFKTPFWAWSSNVYSLDWIVDYAYQTFFPGDTETSFYLALGYGYDSAVRRHVLEVRGVSPAVVSYLPLPPSPTDYWMPRDPG
jgi:hypothetical protein